MCKIYSVRFKTRRGEGSGVIYLVNGKIYGGDDIVAYWGNYEIKDNKFIATISTKRHNKGHAILDDMKELKFEIPFKNEDTIVGSVKIPNIGEQLDIQLLAVPNL